MPQEAQVIYEFPSDFQGKYYEFSSDGGHLSVSGTFHYVTQISSTEVLIAREDVVFLDSIENVENSIGIIDSVAFEGGLLSVYANNWMKTYDVLDYSGVSPRDSMHYIDVQNGHYITGLREGARRDTAACVLRTKGENYYLNIIDYEDCWLVINVDAHGNSLQFTPSMIHWDSDDFEIEQLKNEYNLTLAKRVRGDKRPDRYIADMTDEQYYDLIENSKSIVHDEWIKLEPKKTNWFIWLGVILSLGVVVLMVNYQLIKDKV